MASITSSVGFRIRAHRQKQGLTQEQLAEKANLHFTYIGQVERGEKSLTLVSLDKILNALGITFSEFFESMDTKDGKPSYAVQCYDLVNSRNTADQARLYHILWEVDQLMEAARLGQSGN